MTNPMINPQPNYSGVTIQISNPAVNVGGADKYCGYPQNNYQQCGKIAGMTPTNQIGYVQDAAVSSYMTNPQAQPNAQQFAPQAYPPQYYLNNYNYQTNGKANEETSDLANQNPKQADIDELNKQLEALNSQEVKKPETAQNLPNTNSVAKQEVKEEDMSKSNGIIDDLDARNAQIKADEKNSKQKRVVALTDEYIKSLENYLNNPNDEIRLMASKDILKRLDEDKGRYDDAALNALLNKMLQDPSKVIRVAALSAFASQLASGNDYTVQLLHNIQANPSADKEDVLQAADILLKMSGGTEIKNIPNPAVKDDNKQDENKQSEAKGQ